MGPHLHPLCDTGRFWPQRVPPKVRLDGEAELTASLLAQRLLLLAVLLALLLALFNGLRRCLFAFRCLGLALLVIIEALAADFGRRRRRRRRRRRWQVFGVARVAGLLAFL